MSLSLVTAATVTAITMDEVKAHLRVDHADDDGLIGMYADATASYAFGLQGYTGRCLVNETFDETFDEWPWNCRTGRHELVLGRAKVQSITSVTYLDTDGASTVLASNQYRLLGGDPGVVVEAYDVSWPNLRNTEEAVTVRYVAGYGASWNSVPQDLRLAVAQLAAHWYENREAVVIGQTVNPIPDMYERIFNKYRVWGLR